MYAVFGTANYVVQLEPTPHSLFWDFDAVAYMMMGLAALVIIPALGRKGVERRIRMACAAHVGATVLAGIVCFYPLRHRGRSR